MWVRIIPVKVGIGFDWYNPHLYNYLGPEETSDSGISVAQDFGENVDRLILKTFVWPSKKQ